jgi:hypothetical protein
MTLSPATRAVTDGRGQAVGLEHVSGPLERLVTRLAVEPLPELGHHVRCKHCGTAGQIELFRRPVSNEAAMRCTACGEDHPLAPRPVSPLRHELLTVAQRDRWPLLSSRIAVADQLEAQVAAIFAEARARMLRMLDGPRSLTDEPPEDARNAS